MKLIILAILVTFAVGCETSRSFDHSSDSCTFYMHYQDDTCTNFDFGECTWQECIAWETSGNSTTCSQYQTEKSTNWNSCTNICCDSSVSYAQNSDAINQCQDYLNRKFKLTIIIVCSVVGGVAFIVGIIVLCCCCRQRIGDCCSSLGGRLSDCIRCKCFTRQSQQNYSSNQNHDISIQLNQIDIWKQIESLKPLPNLTACSVCLEEGCSLELECHHLFHRQCILACLNKKEECILCRSTALETARIYCQRCFASYLHVSLKRFKILPSNSMQQICEKCQKNQ